MSKPSFTKEDQVAYLADKWNLDHDRVRQMLSDFRGMIASALARGQRVYLDNLGTMHVEVKRPVSKRLPGHSTKSIFPARINVKLEESELLRNELTTAFRDQLDAANSQG